MQDFAEVQEIEKNNKTETIKDNGVLLISEIQDKVILPYTAEEIQSIIDDENNYYRSSEEIIREKFTKPLSEYKDLHTARFKEAVKLATERDNYSKLDGYQLGAELFSNRYLHPAIIAACKDLNELNVYLDCLDKNELDDFKVFEIKYELYPLVMERGLKTKSLWQKIRDFFARLIDTIKRETMPSKGKH